MDDWKLEPARDLALAPRERRRSAKRESGWFNTLTNAVWWTLMRAYLRSAHRFTIAGRELLPTCAPFIMVANHSSHLDALALCAPLSLRLRARVFPLAAGDTFFTKPSVSLFATHALNALPVWRNSGSRHAFEDLRLRLVEEPCGFVLFPEGTRTRTGEMGLFRPGLGILVAGTEVPVIPCHLRGCFEAWPPQRRFPVLRKVRLTIGTPLSFRDAPNDHDSWQLIASQTRNAVRALGES